MICKPFDAQDPPSDPRLLAGFEAEQDAAHFLDREFAHHPDIRLFHGLRFRWPPEEGLTHAPGQPTPDEFVQVDHLVFHPFGMAIIESKSVSGTLRVDKRKQWTREWRSRSGRTGTENIPDPLLQARRQARGLGLLLDRHQPPLLNKIIGLLPQRFGSFPFEPYVAISTDGRFDGATTPFERCVMKSDRIAVAIREKWEQFKRGSGLRGLLLAKRDEQTLFHLSSEEMSRITDLLVQSHTRSIASPPPPRPGWPRDGSTALTGPALSRPSPASIAAPPRQSQVPPRPAAAATLDNLACTSCGNSDPSNIEVVYRKDYCIICNACGKYTALGRQCRDCGKPARLRKSGVTFHRDCEACGKSQHFWTNRNPA